MASVKEWVKHRRAKGLLAQLSSPDPHACTAAAEGLTALGTAALPDLIFGLKHGDARTRASSARVLGKTGGNGAVTHLLDRLADPSPEVRIAVGRALRDVGSPAVPALVGRLSDHSPDVRCRAITVLGDIADLRASTHLIACLGDDCVAVRQAAVEALGAIRDPRAVPALTALLHDWSPSVSHAALTALDRVGTTEALNALRLWHEERTKYQ
jgi:HEAT repeat protein